MGNSRTLWLGCLFAGCLVAYAQDPDQPVPAPTALPTAAATPTPEPSPEASATPAPSPERAAPELLPESQALPAPTARPGPNPLDLLPNGPVPQALAPSGTQQSATQKLQDVIRFRQIRTLAERDPYAVWLWGCATRADTIEGRREYFRAYYHYTAAQMRKLEPRLQSLIKGYEFERVGSVTQTNIRPTIPLYKLEQREGANAGGAQGRR